MNNLIPELYVNRFLNRQKFRSLYKKTSKEKNPYHMNFDELEVYNCTGKNFNGIMTGEHILVYLELVDGNYKLGEVNDLEYITGFNSRDAHVQSYKTEKRTRGKSNQVIALTHFIIKRRGRKVAGYDKEIHKEINIYRQNNMCSFRSKCKDRDDNKEFLDKYNNSYEHLGILLKVIKDYTGVEQILKCPFLYRYMQESITQKIIKSLEIYGRCLLNAYTGFGKSAISPKIAVEVCKSGDVVLVTTPIVDTIHDFENNIKGFHYGTDVVCFKTGEQNLLSKIETAQTAGKIVFILSSVQDMRYEEIKHREKFDFLKHIEFKLWIRDEYHIHYNALVTSKILNYVKTKYIIDFTATIYKLMEYYRHEYPNDEMIVKFDIFDVLYEKIIKNNSLFKKFPECYINFPDFNAIYMSEKLKELYTSEEEWSPKKLYVMDKYGEFEHRDSIIDHAKMRFDNIGLVNGKYVKLTKQKNSFYINGNVGYYIVPQGSSDINTQEIGAKLKILLNNILSRAVFYTANDFLVEIIKGNPVNQIIDSWQKQHPGKKIVIITHRQLTTGSNIPPLDFILLMDNISSPDEFVQVFGRMTRVFDEKKCVNMYVDCPGMELVVADNIIQTIRAKTSDVVLQKEYFDCLSMNFQCKSKQITFSEAVNCHNKRLNRFFNKSVISEYAITKYSEVINLIKNVPFDKLDGKLKDKSRDVITGDNEGKITKPVERETCGDDNQNKSDKKLNKCDKNRVQTLLAMINESICTGVIERHATFNDVFSKKSKLTYGYFSADNINMMKIALKSKDFCIAVNEWYRTITSEAKNLSMEKIVKMDKFFLNQPFKQKMGLVYIPYKLAKEMIDSPYLNNKDVQRKLEYGTLCVWNSLNGILPILLRKKYPNARIICLEYFPYYIEHLKNMGFETYKIEYKNKEIILPLKVKDMKFDLCIGNPPYQGKHNNIGKATVWDKFIHKSFEFLNDGGYLCFVTPSRWRKPTSNLLKPMTDRQIHYLEIHDEIDGVKNFGVQTRYDLYVIENKKNYKPTVIKDETGKINNIDLSTVPFIPNAEFDKIYSLVAKDTEERVNLLANSAYHHTLNSMNEQQTAEFKYPCIYQINMENEPIYHWSNRNNKGHFGIPKVIVKTGTGGIIIDEDGKYGLTQFAFGIVDEPENLDKIYKALKSYDFFEMYKFLSLSLKGWDKDIISLFRKDFWKDFI